MNKPTKLSWRMEIDGKEYGNDIIVYEPIDLEDCIKTMSKNWIRTLKALKDK